MMRLLILLLLTAAAAAQPIFGDKLIVGGKRVGAVHLLETSAELLTAAGVPDHATPLPAAHTSWRYDRWKIMVYLKSEKVVAIFVHSPDLKTA